MAKDKKGFILYADLIHTVDKMPSDKAGDLFKHILKYVNDLNPITTDLIIELTFEPIKQQLKRDLNKWEDKSQKRSNIGREGGLKSGEARRSKMKQNEPIGSKLKQNEQVNVNVNVNDILTKVNNIDSRKLKFASTLQPFLPIYGKEVLNDFYSYWTEPNKSNTKFRQELEKAWDVERRLKTWTKNETIKPKVAKPYPSGLM